MYAKIGDFTDSQKEALKRSCKNLFFITENSFDKVIKDKEDKIIAFDPDIVDWKLDNNIIDKISNLKAICLETTGFEWIDTNYCKNKGIIVTNVPKYATTAVAEQAVFMAFALTRKYPFFAKEGKMNYDKQFVAGDMLGKTAGIIGLGSIGTRIAEMCRGLGMNIMYSSREKSEIEGKLSSIDEILTKADYIFFCLAKNEETKKLVTNDKLVKVNKNANVITIANGLIDNKFFIDKVAKGEINGFAFENQDCDLTKYKGNVFVTPFCAYYTEKALINMFKIWVDTIISATKSKPINKVN